MISELKLEAIVRNALMDNPGVNAAAIAHRTGVPIERVQRVMHRLNGADPAEAAKRTAKRRRQQDQRTFGGAYISPQAARSLKPGR